MTVLAPQGAPARLDDAHARAATEVVACLDSDAERGLAAGEAARRGRITGANELPAPARTPAWRRLLAQFTDRLILMLLVAAVVAFVVSGELKTPIVVLVVVVLNGIVGFVQEGRAERSLEALRSMLVEHARVVRDGAVAEVPAAELVPGDVVLLAAGDRVPADGRLLTAEQLEIDEAVLTGESTPSSKALDPVQDAASIGDRSCMAFMNTTVTRGKGTALVTAIGSRTQVGRIARLLDGAAPEPTPLQRQLDRLARSLARMAALIVGAVFLIGLARGESVEDMALTAVALAVAAIPEGLPAVTAITLALGVAGMARENAIVKRLASVETLGCTDVVCSDKTGTLTLNQMTAVEVFAGLVPYRVTGSGYATSGAIEAVEVESAVDDGNEALELALRGMALCSDALVDEDDGHQRLIGDPTEGAVVVLAAKAAFDARRLRASHPRIAEVPFDSAHKYMATLHPAANDGAALFVKGAPDVVLTRVSGVADRRGVERAIAEVDGALHVALEEMAAKGLRVLAIAGKVLEPHQVAAFVDASDRHEHLTDLRLLALVGIVDPAREEAARAIAQARAAGVRVKMITGDHPGTAAAIADQLGLGATVATGADLAAWDDAELAARIDEIDVLARVSPEDKLRVVGALQRNGHVVAMTGDGVNDAPAVKRADIGIAMGVTGTEVTKQAATMVLADDNFATIVGAITRGRAIYDNVVSFVRFQLSTTLGFALLFLLAGALGVAGGQPFAAIAILWVNLVMDGPPAVALALDPAAPDVMRRPPRPTTERILTRARWTAVGLSAVVMAAVTLAVLAWAPEATATTMAFNTFVLFQFFNVLNARSDRRSVFSRQTLANRWLWLALAVVAILQVTVTHVGVMQELFETTSISATQWLLCIVLASSALWVEEARKLVVRHREGGEPQRAAADQPVRASGTKISAKV